MGRVKCCSPPLESLHCQIFQSYMDWAKIVLLLYIVEHRRLQEVEAKQTYEQKRLCDELDCVNSYDYLLSINFKLIPKSCVVMG